MATRPKIVFLYSELAGYFLACATELSNQADVLIFRWKINKEAPFKFNFSDGLTVLVKDDFTQKELLEKITSFSPDIIVCSGWMDKNYLKTVKSFKKQIPTVLTLDNHWNGSFKQKIASFISPFYLTNRFTHAWVPGKPQQEFAQKLGFKNILLGFYCADVNSYNNFYKKQSAGFKKRFLYVGRYVKHKGIYEMWQAFIELQNELPNEWEMLCIGTGDEWDNRIKHPKIKHIGFVQPNNMWQYLQEKSVYILPSKFEPWGVTVQEFAITSCPLILSKNVGANEQFLIHNQNGILVDDVTIKTLKNAMKIIMNKSEDELLKMSETSHKLGMSYTPKMWTEKILSILKNDSEKRF
ncbi:MAG TPA: glycosyltransferase family 1 protein [Crocinitomix sp.]|nr:glycosyltransferase family 1 protein [Crocinitomix sp.]